jgi:hypothetical protein
MVEELLRILHERWPPTDEVWVTRPVRGVIDLVLESADSGEPLITMEAHSRLRRLEQQVRWAYANSEALAQTRQRMVRPLLLPRNARHTRAVVAEHAATLRAAYPAHAADAYSALTAATVWPGAAILWVDVTSARGGTRIRSSPPRGITVGR